MKFEQPIILLLLWILPMLGVGLYLLRCKKLQKAKLLVPGSITKLSGGIFFTQLSLLLIALALGIVALARPQWGMRTETIYSNGRNVAILVDVSRSMLAQDVHPNRLERSKADLVDLVAESKGERIAIIAFRSRARMLCPFTTDTAYLLETISGIGADSAPRGETNIGAAMQAALNLFPEGDDSHNAIILISDGEDLSGKSKSYAEKAAERGIPIFCIGIGDVAGTTIPQTDAGGQLKFKGETVVTKLDNKTLQTIANITKGAYIPLATAGTGKTTLGDVFNRYISRLAVKDREEQRENHYVERYQLFLLPAIICILCAGILSYGRPGAGRRKVKSVVILLLGASSIASYADTETNVVESNVMPLPIEDTIDSATTTNDVPDKVEVYKAYSLAREAQAQYKKNSFKEAAELYDKAALDIDAEPAFLQNIYFNSGVAWLACTNYEAAIKSFECVSAAELLPKAKEAIGFAKYKLAIPEIDNYNKNPENMVENGFPKDFEATIRAKEEHIAKLNEALKYFREAASLKLSAAEDLASVKESIFALNERLSALAKERDLFKIIVKHAGKPFEVHIKELADGVKRTYEQISPSVNSGVPNQSANNEASSMLKEVKEQWELGNFDISPQYFIANGIQSGKFASLGKPVHLQHFGVVHETLGKYKSLRSNPNALLKDLANAENALVAMQLALVSPPALLEQAIAFETNACENAFDKNYLYTPSKYQKGAILFGWGFTESFTNWITRLQASETKTFNEEIGGNCFDEQKLEQCKQIPPESIEQIKQLNGELRDILLSIYPTDGELGDILSEEELAKAKVSLTLMQQIYALLFPQDQNQDRKQQNQDQEKKQNQDQSKQQQQQNQKQQEQNQQQSNSEQAQEQKSDEQQTQEQQQQQDQQQQKAEQKEAEQQEAQATETKLNDKEAEELLKRLLMQERERKEKKRQNEEFVPMDRNTRDW